MPRIRLRTSTGNLETGRRTHVSMLAYRGRQMRQKTRDVSVHDLAEPCLVPDSVLVVRRLGRMAKKDFMCLCVLSFLVCLWTLWVVRGYAARPWVVLGCGSTRIHGLWQVSADQRFPMLCPWCKCRKQDAYLVVQCAECGELRFVTSYRDTEVCPHCCRTRLVRDIHKGCRTCKTWYVDDHGHDCHT